MNAPMVAMIALWMLIVLTLRGPLIAPVVWATLEMDVIVQVGPDARGMCEVDTSPSVHEEMRFSRKRIIYIN